MVNLNEIKNRITFTKRIELHKEDLNNFKRLYENCKNNREKYYLIDNFRSFSISSSRYFNESVQEFDDHDYYLTIKIDKNEYIDYYLQNIHFLDKAYKYNFSSVMYQLKQMVSVKNMNKQINKINMGMHKYQIERTLEKLENKKSIQYKHSMRKYFKNNIKRELLEQTYRKILK
jgi:hypothetical protein